MRGLQIKVVLVMRLTCFPPKREREVKKEKEKERRCQMSVKCLL